MTEPTKARGRPRNPLFDEAILETTRAALVDAGYARLSIEGIARQSRVAKTTVYRRWPSKAVLVWDAVFGTVVAETILPDTGTLQEDLTRLVAEIAGVLGSPVARAAMPGLLTDFTSADPLRQVVQQSFLSRARAQLVIPFERAAERGELRPSASVPTALAALVGGLFFRATVSELNFDAAFVGELVALVTLGTAAS